jgi:hypothetical protein
VVVCDVSKLDTFNTINYLVYTERINKKDMLKRTAITVAADGYAVANNERMTALVKILIKKEVGDMINLTNFCHQAEEYRSNWFQTVDTNLDLGFVVVRTVPELADKLHRVFGNEGLGKEVEIRRLN